MTVTNKPLAERDFFAWYELFTAYAGSMGIDLDDERTMRVWASLQGDTGYTVEDLFVDEQARGRGVATAIVEHIRTRAEAEHRATVRWATKPDDPAALALTEKFSASAGDWVLRDLPVG